MALWAMLFASDAINVCMSDAEVVRRHFLPRLVVKSVAGPFRSVSVRNAISHNDIRVPNVFP